MDFENIFYVILAVIYFLSRVLKGKKQVPKEEESYNDPETTGKKPVSFEDLLKEFVGETEEKEAETVLEEENKRADQTPQEYQSAYSDEEAKSIFEKSVRDAELIRDQEKTQEDRKLVFKEFAPYQEQEETNEFASELKQMLQSEDGGKKAIVLGEILNRRY